MADITLESFWDTALDAGTKAAAREALDIWLTQASSTNSLTITGSGGLTISTGAYTVTVPATGTMVLNDNSATLTNKILTAATITTSLTPTSNDGAALGSTSLKFSDLFLASGAVINFNSGDVTITHSANTLEIAGGDLIVSSLNGLTVATSAPGTTVTVDSNLLVSGLGQITLTNAGATNTTLVSGTMATLTGAETLTNKVLTAATITTSLTPTSNDGAALGSTSLKFSDLFLASGAVINFDSGDVTFTHTANVVTVAGGDLRITTAGTNSDSVVTVGGTQTLTNKTLTSPAISGASTTIVTPTISGGGEWGGTPTFNSGLISEDDLFSDGDITVRTDAGKVGYSTGAGGSGSTTGSSPNFAITLSKPCGQITTAALTTAGGAEEFITVTNTTVAAQDVIVLSTTYSGAGTPVLSVKGVGSSTFTIVITNVSSSAFDAAMTINYAVIKAVVA